MAAPSKTGLNYFNIDCDIECDPKIEYLDSLHIHGFSVYIRLLAKIYRNGYFLNWHKKDSIIFAKKINIDVEDIKKIINICLDNEINLFDQNLYEQYEILTSAGIQKRYLFMKKRKYTLYFLDKFLLINPLENKHSNQEIIIVDINSDNTHNNYNKCIQKPYEGSIMHTKTTQSKVKESKVKESKVKESKVKESKVKESKNFPEWLDQKSFFGFCEMRIKIKKPLTPHATELLFKKLEKFKNKGYDPNEILDNSTMSCWQGIFEPKNKNKFSSKEACGIDGLQELIKDDLKKNPNAYD